MESLQTALALHHNSKGEFLNKRRFLGKGIKWLDWVLMRFMLLTDNLALEHKQISLLLRLECTDTDGTSLSFTEMFDMDGFNTHLRSKLCCYASIDICWLLHLLYIFLNRNGAGTEKK